MENQKPETLIEVVQPSDSPVEIVFSPGYEELPRHIQDNLCVEVASTLLKKSMGTIIFVSIIDNYDPDNLHLAFFTKFRDLSPEGQQKYIRKITESLAEIDLSLNSSNLGNQMIN